MWQIGHTPCCDVEFTSMTMTLIQRCNNVVCPVGGGLRTRGLCDATKVVHLAEVDQVQIVQVMTSPLVPSVASQCWFYAQTAS